MSVKSFIQERFLIKFEFWSGEGTEIVSDRQKPDSRNISSESTNSGSVFRDSSSVASEKSLSEKSINSYKEWNKHV